MRRTALGLAAAIWVVVIVFIWRAVIHAEEITEDSITLAPVSSAFIDALQYERTGVLRDSEDDYDPYPGT